MTIRQIRYFMAVANSGSLARAAEIIHISVPPLSLSIKELEKELDVQLFVRSKQGVVLTEAGTILYRGAQQVLKELEETVARIKEYKTGASSVLRIGSISAVSIRLLPKLLRDFKREHPHTELMVWEESTPDLLGMVDRGELDLAIVRLPFNRNKYVSERLFQMDLQRANMRQDCFYAIGDPVLFPKTRTDDLPLVQLNGIPLVIHSRYVPILRGHCEKQSFEPNIIFQSHDVSSLLSWAGAGLAVAIVPYTSSLLNDSPDVIRKKIVDPVITSQAYVIWSRSSELKAEAKEMVELLCHPRRQDGTPLEVSEPQ